MGIGQTIYTAMRDWADSPIPSINEKKKTFPKLFFSFPGQHSSTAVIYELGGDELPLWLFCV
jgi:hypothetical protein